MSTEGQLPQMNDLIFLEPHPAMYHFQYCKQFKNCMDDTTLINSLGPKFSSQGHFHSLQLLNVPQFLFSRVVRLKTAPRGNFSHA